MVLAMLCLEGRMKWRVLDDDRRLVEDVTFLLKKGCNPNKIITFRGVRLSFDGSRSGTLLIEMVCSEK